MGKKPSNDKYPEEEAQRRFEQALKGGLKTPPQRQEKRASKPKLDPKKKR